jgi:pSer/pThr/pTyr-binding forkhead associated (FHA) protein
MFIKDVKSSNGTFINGERLSPEGLESDPFELLSDDIIVRPRNPKIYFLVK